MLWFTIAHIQQDHRLHLNLNHRATDLEGIWEELLVELVAFREK